MIGRAVDGMEIPPGRASPTAVASLQAGALSPRRRGADAPLAIAARVRYKARAECDPR